MSTGIEWTDETWNPVTGCTKVSPGCDHCYAETITERFHGKGSFAEVKLHPERMDKPLRWRKPRRVFVNSMSDLFHADVPDDYIARVFAVMATASRHTFQVLTKRHARMRSLLSSGRFQEAVREEVWSSLDLTEDAAELVFERHWPLSNVWLGVSVEDQKWADVRIPALLDTPAAVRFLSCEPLLGPVDLSAWTYHVPWSVTEYGTECSCGAAVVGERDRCNGPRIHWVIVGGESGPGARPMHPDWSRDLRDQCVDAGVPFLFKQWGEWAPEGPATQRPVAVANDGTVYQPGDLTYPDGPRYGEAVRARHDKAHLTAMYRVSKKRAGRELDGRTWDEFPNNRTEATL